MFGSSSDKIEKLVEKNDWDKIERKFVDGSDEEKLALAKACYQSKTEGSRTVLNMLIKDPNDQVKLEAIKSLGNVGDDRASSPLEWVASSLSPDKTELIAAARAAIHNVRGKRP